MSNNVEELRPSSTQEQEAGGGGLGQKFLKRVASIFHPRTYVCSFAITPEVHNTFLTLQEGFGLKDEAAVFGRAMSLLKFALDTHKKGGIIGFEDVDGNFVELKIPGLSSPKRRSPQELKRTLHLVSSGEENN